MANNVGVNKFKIFAQTQLDSGATTNNGFSFVNKFSSPWSVQSFPPSDFYIPLFLTRKNYFDYVDVSRDQTQYVIQRQEVNPYFIEFSLFDSVGCISPSKGSQLSTGQTSYLVANIPALIGYSNSQVREWYDSVGYDSLPITVGNNTITADSIAASDFVPSQASSMATFFDVTINS